MTSCSPLLFKNFRLVIIVVLLGGLCRGSWGRGSSGRGSWGRGSGGRGNRGRGNRGRGRSGGSALVAGLSAAIVHVGGVRTALANGRPVGTLGVHVFAGFGGGSGCGLGLVFHALDFPRASGAGVSAEHISPGVQGANARSSAGCVARTGEHEWRAARALRSARIEAARVTGAGTGVAHVGGIRLALAGGGPVSAICDRVGAAIDGGRSFGCGSGVGKDLLDIVVVFVAIQGPHAPDARE